MMGLPQDRTWVERGLLTLGSTGAGLGVFFMGLAVVVFFLVVFGLTDMFNAGLYFPLFMLGAMGVVAGLGLAALGQALASLRQIAHNYSRQEPRQ